MKILCSISTKDRYFTTLPLTLQSVGMQTRKPDSLIIFDDGERKDLRHDPLYKHIFSMLSQLGIDWSVEFGDGQGQHFNHERANIREGFDAVWRVDDDLIVAPDCLEKLEKTLLNHSEVAAVGPLILSDTPILDIPRLEYGKIENIMWAPNLQWYANHKHKGYHVDHLHCSFLYRSGLAHYNLDLSPVAHREETMFTYSLRQLPGRNGKESILHINTEAKSWHLRSPQGGIRAHQNAFFYKHDEKVFTEYLAASGVRLARVQYCCLDMGLGDHWAFKHVLPEIAAKYETVIVPCCHRDVFDDLRLDNVVYMSIHEAISSGIDTKEQNIYAFMAKTGYQGNIVDAFREMYL